MNIHRYTEGSLITPRSRPARSKIGGLKLRIWVSHISMTKPFKTVARAMVTMITLMMGSPIMGRRISRSRTKTINTPATMVRPKAMATTRSCHPASGMIVKRSG